MKRNKLVERFNNSTPTFLFLFLRVVHIYIGVISFSLSDASHLSLKLGCIAFEAAQPQTRFHIGEPIKTSVLIRVMIKSYLTNCTDMSIVLFNLKMNPINYYIRKYSEKLLQV